MRLDHIAYRVEDRNKTADFLKKTLDYRIGTEFEIKFEDDSSAKCLVLEPYNKLQGVTWIEGGAGRHVPPEIFVSNGTPDSIVGKWVQERDGTGGIHHLAYQVIGIESTIKEWKDNGVEFLTEEAIECPDDNMKQIFTKPLDMLGGIIIELIERGDKGFCKENVKDLMESTQPRDFGPGYNEAEKKLFANDHPGMTQEGN